jgi:hypothetical protein
VQCGPVATIATGAALGDQSAAITGAKLAWTSIHLPRVCCRSDLIALRRDLTRRLL